MSLNQKIENMMLSNKYKKQLQFYYLLITIKISIININSYFIQ